MEFIRVLLRSERLEQPAPFVARFREELRPDLLLEGRPAGRVRRIAEFVRIEAQPRDQFAIKLWLDRPHSDPLSVGAAIAVVEMRAAVEAIRLASVLPSDRKSTSLNSSH